MKKTVATVIIAAALLTASAVPAFATEQDGLDLIATRDITAGQIGQVVNDNIEAARRAAEEAKRAAIKRQQEAKNTPVESHVADKNSYDGAVYLGTCEITAYCACSKCCGKSDGITATGTTATQGRTVAVDPSVIPYGSVVIINGHEYIAEDCGGGIGGTQIDMFFNDHQEALNWGRRWLDVWVRKV